MEEWDVHVCVQFRLENQNNDTVDRLMSCKPLLVQIILWNFQFWITIYKLLELSHHLIDARSPAYFVLKHSDIRSCFGAWCCWWPRSGVWRQVSKNVNGRMVLSHGLQSNAEKAQCKFCRCQIRTHRSALNIHDVSNKHPRNAVPHYTMRQNGDWLNFDCQKSSDSSDQLFRFAFVNS